MSNRSLGFNESAPTSPTTNSPRFWYRSRAAEMYLELLSMPTYRATGRYRKMRAVPHPTSRIRSSGRGGQTAQRVISSPLPSRPHSSGHCRLGVGITNSIIRECARLSRSGGVSCERHHGAKSIIKSHRPNLTGDSRLWLTKRRRRERRCRSGRAPRYLENRNQARQTEDFLI
jgi:hypothetical protein